MAFSSISFLFYFLPLFFIIYYLIPARAKNVVLLTGSLFFYAWSEPRWILLLLASILVTWLLGRAMRPEASAGRRRGLLILGLVFQLGLLVAVKYAGFFFGAFIDLPKLHLPLGVSFYTFHAISWPRRGSRGCWCCGFCRMRGTGLRRGGTCGITRSRPGIRRPAR